MSHPTPTGIKWSTPRSGGGGGGGVKINLLTSLLDASVLGIQVTYGRSKNHICVLCLGLFAWYTKICLSATASRGKEGQGGTPTFEDGR